MARPKFEVGDRLRYVRPMFFPADGYRTCGHQGRFEKVGGPVSEQAMSGERLVRLPPEATLVIEDEAMLADANLMIQEKSHLEHVARMLQAAYSVTELTFLGYLILDGAREKASGGDDGERTNLDSYGNCALCHKPIDPRVLIRAVPVSGKVRRVHETCYQAVSGPSAQFVGGTDAENAERRPE